MVSISWIVKMTNEVKKYSFMLVGVGEQKVVNKDLLSGPYIVFHLNHIQSPLNITSQ